MRVVNIDVHREVVVDIIALHHDIRPARHSQTFPAVIVGLVVPDGHIIGTKFDRNT
jgi:hypothetical protein